jgi:small GTP-binding protein
MASAPVFTTDRIRNVVVVGHGGSGKTTLIDACCHASGASRRHGSSAEGTALTMFTPEEISHGISMNVSVAYATWMDAKINFLDTPGYLDFLGETRAGARVADGAIVVLSGPNGVEVGTERVWDLVQEHHLPTIFFTSMLDRHNADFERVYQDVKEHVGIPRHRQSLQRPRPLLRPRHADRRVHGGRHPGRAAAGGGPVLRGDDRDDRRHGRQPPGALPGR